MATNILRELRNKEREVFPTIPGMMELLSAGPDTIDNAVMKHPLAAFACRMSNEIFCHDKEISQITLRAYLQIVNGGSIAEIKHRYEKDMALYAERHNWDAR